MRGALSGNEGEGRGCSGRGTGICGYNDEMGWHDLVKELQAAQQQILHLRAALAEALTARATADLETSAALDMIVEAETKAGNELDACARAEVQLRAMLAKARQQLGEQACELALLRTEQIAGHAARARRLGSSLTTVHVDHTFISL